MRRILTATLLPVLTACGGGSHRGAGGANPGLAGRGPLPHPSEPGPPPEAAACFRVKPYLQLGDAPEAFDRMTLLWHARDGLAGWAVEVRADQASTWIEMAPPTSSLVAGLPYRHRPHGHRHRHPHPNPRWRRRSVPGGPGGPGGARAHRVWTAQLGPLVPGAPFSYRVLRDGQEVFRATALARKAPGQSQRMAVAGGLGEGTGPARAIAFQIHAQNPDLLVAVGDLACPRGTAHDYRSRFFPACNADRAEPREGAPFMRSRLVVGVLGSHDVDRADRQRVPPRRGLAYYCYLYMDWRDPGLRRWLEAELARAQDAKWRFVAFHHPAFDLASGGHPGDRRMRELWPLFERYRVDLVFTGQLHTYQRTTPLAFTPEPAGGPDSWRFFADEHNLVADTAFDGATVTQARWPLHILTGAGGGPVHAAPLPPVPKPFHGKVVANTHSFSLLDIHDDRIDFRQVDARGATVDAFTLIR